MWLLSVLDSLIEVGVDLCLCRLGFHRFLLIVYINTVSSFAQSAFIPLLAYTGHGSAVDETQRQLHTL